MSSPVAELSRTEALLLWRNPTSLFMGLALPSLMLTMQGTMFPGLRTPLGGDDPIYADLRGIDFLVPIVLLVTIASVALVNFPQAIAGYRETGVLRRIQATPAGAPRLLTAQLIISAATIALGTALAMTLAMVILGAQPPDSVPLLILSITLAILGLFAFGSLVAGLATNGRNANGIGMLIFFLCLLTAGIWSPGPMMPDWAQTLTGLTPFGAASQTLSAAWLGTPFPWLLLAVMAAWAAITGLIAVKAFRWR